MYHEAYSVGIERDEASGLWKTVDETEPIWAESNWPAEMHVVLYPYGAARTAESLFLLAVGLLAATLTYCAILISQRQYKQQYKRL